MTRYVLPSPFAQKVRLFFEDRLAGTNGCEPGENMTPAHAKGRPSSISPETSSACLLPFAPSVTTFMVPVDFPPAMLSVEILQPEPKLASDLPLSKSLTTPGSEPGGAG